MSGFSLLWGKILKSSLWINESKETRLVWITMLALRDKDGFVEASIPGLADYAKVSPEECRKAIRILMAPDPDDTSKVEKGRRIREVQGGWIIVNHDLYRFSTEAKREAWRLLKADQRAKAAEAEVFNEARKKEYARRRRTKREIRLAGARAGASQAINDGLRESRENKTASGQQ